MKRLVALVLVAALALPGMGYAQDGASAAPAIDASKMGVSLDRIRRKLGPADSTQTVQNHGLKLDYRVEVYGLAPKVDYFKDFSLTYGPVPNSAPTHRQFLEHVTPQDFKGQTVPIFGLAVWAAQKIAEKSKKSRCEREIEDYRATLMQGIAITAPRCSQ